MSFTWFTDDFNRADSASLGNGWQDGYTSHGNPQIASNAVEAGGVGSSDWASQPTVMDQNQWAQFTFATLTTALGSAGIGLRLATPPDSSGYILFGHQGGERILSFDVDGNATILADGATAFATSDVFYGTAVENDFTVYLNGTSALTVNDATYARTGRAGLQMNNNAFPLTTVVLDNYSMGTFRDPFMIAPLPERREMFSAPDR